MTSTSLGNVDVLVIYGDAGPAYQLAFPDPNCQIDQLSGPTMISSNSSYGRTVVNFSIARGATLVQVTGGTRLVLVLILDTKTAYFTWEAVVPGPGTLGSQYKIGSNETALVIGP